MNVKAYEEWKGNKGKDFVDQTLDDSTSNWKITNCLQVALLCVQENPVERPTMLEVYSMLKNGPSKAIVGTPKRPAFSAKTHEDVSGSTQQNYSFNDPDFSQLTPR